jgi:large subunit ribosomal protein L13
MKTYMAKPGQVEQNWWLVDASDQVVGRLATRLATILMGKHRATYTPHVDTGDFVVVTNAAKVRFTGNKWQTKVYQRYSGYPGGLKEETADALRRRKPEEILRQAVKRMLPKSDLGRKMLAKLKIYRDEKHRHQAQQPQPLEL